MPTAPQRTAGRRAPGAFTLIELLVVIAIIAILVAIIIPALGGARNIARKTASQALMTDLANAISQFNQDNNGRMPGYFSQQTLGMNPQDQGLTVLENAMLELAGTRQITSTTALGGGGGNNESVPLHGRRPEGIHVNPDLAGIGDDVYFVPPARNYVPQVQGKQVGKFGAAAPEGQKQLPDLIDFFGNPILLWIEDDSAPRLPSDIDEFAAGEFRLGADTPSRFYWRANQGFLASTSLGRMGKDQTVESLIGASSPNQEVVTSLAGLLGDPKFPTPTNFTSANVLPGTARGKFIVHAAGPDGVYLGRRDRGARRLPSNDPILRYAWNFFVPGTSNKYLDSQGNTTVEDVLEGFDDIIVTGGN